MRKFIENTGFWLLIVTFLAVLAMFVSGFFGIDRYLVVSGSMEPSLYAGDIVFVNSNVDFEDVEIGDVIIFKYQDLNIIHRVIEKISINEKMYFKTKGDANKVDDGYLTTEDNFCGVALCKFKIPKLGFLIDYNNSIER